MKSILLAVLFLVIITFLIGNLTTKSQNMPSENSKIPKIIKKNGWEIPKTEDLLFSLADKYESDELTINEKCYTLKNRTVTNINSYLVTDEKNIVINSYDVQLRSVCSYQAKEKIFAYRISYNPFAISEDKVRYLMGAILENYYFDEDGDGIFETLYPISDMPKDLPVWLKNK